MPWTNDDLLRALGRYEDELAEAGLEPVSIESFVGYSRRFLRWRGGDYRPRSAVGPGRQPTKGSVDLNGLGADLIDYEVELRTAKLQPLAVQTYIDQASRFVRWLGGTYTPRTRAPSRQAPPPEPEAETHAPDTGSTPDAIILGCVSMKHHGPAKAKDLYASPLFAKRRRYAEMSGKPWFIFSAKHGILQPDDVIEWYDVALSKEPIATRRVKGVRAAGQLEALVGAVNGKTFEIHAGASYVKALDGPLRARGGHLVNPFARLGFGEQLHRYDELAGHAAPKPATSPPRRPALPPRPLAQTAVIDPTDLTIDAITELGPFDFRWPTDVEHFDHGWVYIARTGGGSHRVKHGIGGRVVYGKYRVHTVTWLDDQPMVEGVASDDYDESGALLSLLRIGGSAHVRDLTDLPIGYAGFTIVRQSDEIVAKYSRNSLAVKVLEDDLPGWARHAILRARSKGSGAATGRPTLPVRPSAPSPAPLLQPPPDLDEGAIVRALLDLAETAKAETNTDGEPFFTPNPAANRFLIENPFAFLLAVIFDQGIVAERAWAAPYELQRRLGHLDPVRMVSEPDRVADAIRRPPMLQRFVNTIPPWVVAAAQRVITRYDGDAGRIWDDSPTADVLTKRLESFQGIGQKKAAMAVEMLERDLKVEIRELHGTDIAYDVHVRRVFLRTGLANRDDRDHMVEAGRRLNPARPGAIDFPMWLIGRRWCRPGVPLCSECPLFEVCPRLVDRASEVRGA